jgi:hypothetical protein
MQPEPPATKTARTKRPKTAPLVIGWREIVALPDLGLEAFRAKIDTGARTTALHATHIATYLEDGAEHEDRAALLYEHHLAPPEHPLQGRGADRASTP